MNVQAVFFDLDGTLVDSELLWARALASYLNDRGRRVDEQTVIQIVYGHAWSAIYREVVTLHPPLIRTGMAEMAEQLRPYYLRLREQSSIAIPESIDCLRRLAAALPVAIVSGSPRREIEDTMHLVGIADCVQFFIGSEDYDAGKPDPTCYQLAADRLSADPARCVVIEDSRAGVHSARDAGMKCIALVRPDALPQDVQAADRVVSSLQQVTVDDLERMVGA